MYVYIDKKNPSQKKKKYNKKTTTTNTSGKSRGSARLCTTAGANSKVVGLSSRECTWWFASIPARGGESGDLINVYCQ
jgi:hypothetical protein